MHDIDVYKYVTSIDVHIGGHGIGWKVVGVRVMYVEVWCHLEKTDFLRELFSSKNTQNWLTRSTHKCLVLETPPSIESHFYRDLKRDRIHCDQTHTCERCVYNKT